jgi:glycosyltransferase involved in cell wall biosynthesis
MRIVFVINSLIYGGAESQLIVISRALVRRGHSVLICTLRDKNPRIGELENSGVEISVDRKHFRFDPALVARLRHRIRNYRADVVQGLLHEGNLYALLSTVGAGIPAIVSERSDAYKLPLQYRLAIWSSKSLASAIIANSNAGARHSQLQYLLPDRDVHVVRNACLVSPQPTAPAIAKAQFKCDDVKIISVVGRINPVKDHSLALRALQRLRRIDSRWRLLIVGDAGAEESAYSKALQEDVISRELSEFVCLTGFRDDSVDMIQGSDVLLSTSVREGCPNVVLEAMAVGTPVISTAYSDIRDILPFPWQVCSNRDPDDLAAAILRADRSRADVIREQLDWIVNNATVERVTSKLESIYGTYAQLTGSARAV